MISALRRRAITRSPGMPRLHVVGMNPPCSEECVDASLSLGSNALDSTTTKLAGVPGQALLHCICARKDSVNRLRTVPGISEHRQPTSSPMQRREHCLLEFSARVGRMSRNSNIRVDRVRDKRRLTDFRNPKLRTASGPKMQRSRCRSKDRNSRRLTVRRQCSHLLRRCPGKVPKASWQRL